MMKICMVSILLFAISVQAFSQDKDLEYFLVASGNFYLPGSSSNKGIYPILWYDKDHDPKLMVGGFGIGVSVFKPLKERLFFKAQSNVSRQAYWNEPIQFRDANNTPLGEVSVKGVDYSLGLTGTVHYFFNDVLSIGSGFGVQVLLVSTSKPEDVFTPSSSINYVNKHYKPIMPLLPVELGLKFEKMMFNIRYELGLLNRYRNELSDSETEKYSLLTFELGYRIK